MVRVDCGHRRELVLDQPLVPGLRSALTMTTHQKVLVALGTLGLGILVWRIGVNAVRSALLQLGWGMALILGQGMAAHLLNRVGGRFAFARVGAGSFPPGECVGLRVGGGWVPLLPP